VPTTPTGLTAISGPLQVSLNWNANPVTDNVKYYVIFSAPGLGQPFGSAVQIGTSATPSS
jgi:hypothetical protein